MTYHIEGFLETNEDMEQNLLMLEELFAHDSEAEDLICGACSGSEPTRASAIISSALGLNKS